MLQYRFWLEWLLDVPPTSFDPPPKVDSAVVRLIPRDPAELTAIDEAELSRVVTAAFAQRRKMLRNNLKGCSTMRNLPRLAWRRRCVQRTCR